MERAMGKWVTGVFAIGLLFGQSGAGAQGDLSITVRVFDRAGLPAATLEQARHEVARIFVKAGIEVQWIDCPAGSQRDAACDQELTPRDLVLRVLGGSNPSNSGHYFGSAVTVEGSGFGHYATIFHGGVLALANGEAMFEGLLLGYAIAHELGHLLLGPNNHAATGIMMARWGEKVLRNVPKDSFLFTRGQAERLRTAVLARVRAAEAQPLPEIAAVQ